MNKLLPLFFCCCFSALLSAQNHYMNITTFGILAGTSTDAHKAPVSMISEHHYRINRFSAGLMTGIEQLNENILPLATVIRYHQPAGSGSWFISGYTGYGISLEKPQYYGIKKAQGGIMAGADTGFMIHINSCASVFIGVGYRYNILHYKLENYWVGNYRRNEKMNRFSARLGIVL